jgi:hypothetical protein
MVNCLGNNLRFPRLPPLRNTVMFKPHAFSLFAVVASMLVLGTAFSPQAMGASAKEIYANPYRAYPASCLNDGLPLGKSAADPNAQTLPVTLYTYNGNLQGYVTEADSATVWRVPCSGGTAATLLEIDRPAASNGSTTIYPVLPQIYLYESATGATTVVFPRLAQEPNTLFEDTPQSTPIYSSSVYVLELYNPTNTLANPLSNYDDAFALYLASQAGGTAAIINVPAYVPPPEPPNMEISGYMSTNWSNPSQSGEGMVTQVYDNGDKATRTLTFAWFTYDSTSKHLPFWLYGQASFPIGTTQVTAQTVYFSGGTFAGTLASGVPNTPWGSVTVSFSDCGHMNITYTGDASAVQGPTGSGTASFVRVADVNGLVCQ